MFSLKGRAPVCRAGGQRGRQQAQGRAGTHLHKDNGTSAKSLLEKYWGPQGDPKKDSMAMSLMGMVSFIPHGSTSSPDHGNT